MSDGSTHQRTGPLAGIKVVEAATYMSGPYATQLLADLGAEVIKVEAPGRGDIFRNFGRPETYVSAQFASMNRGKLGIVLDLKDPADNSKLLGLLDQSDVLLCNWRAGVADSLGFTDEVLESRNPRLVRVFITGYGKDGPSSDEPAYDTALQARSALMDALSPDDPHIVPGWPIDKYTALIAVQSVLAALYQREKTGRGERIDIAMLDVAASLNFPDLFSNRVFVDHQPEDAHNPQLYSLRPLRASDGYVVIAPANSRQVTRTLEAAGRPDWVDEVLSTKGQAALVTKLFELLNTVTPEATVEEWLTRFRTHDVPCSACTTMDGLLEDPQVVHNGVFRIERWPDAGAVRVARYPARFADYDDLIANGAAPRLGEHNDEVFGAP